MRTKVKIDAALVAEAMTILGLETRQATVEEALRSVVRQARRRALRELAGIGWEGDLDAMRTGRSAEPGP